MADRDLDAQEKDKQLADLLESLLSTCSVAEPRPGLEIRIRAALKNHTMQRQRRWVFIFAASVAAVLLAVLMANMHSAKQGIPDHASLKKSPPEIGSSNTEKAMPMPRAAN